MRSRDTSIVLESWMKVFKWHMLLCMSECVTCCFIQLINQGSIVFFQEWEDISSFHGVRDVVILTGDMGPSFFFTEGSNFSVFFGWGMIFIIEVGQFTWTFSVLVLSSARTAYLLFSNDLEIGTAGWLVSTIQTENPSLLLCLGRTGEHAFLLDPSWLAALQTFLHWFLVHWKLRCGWQQGWGRWSRHGHSFLQTRHMTATCAFPNSIGTSQLGNIPGWLEWGVDEVGVGGGPAGGEYCHCWVWVLGAKQGLCYDRYFLFNKLSTFSWVHLILSQHMIILSQGTLSFIYFLTRSRSLLCYHRFFLISMLCMAMPSFLLFHSDTSCITHVHASILCTAHLIFAPTAQGLGFSLCIQY